MATSNEPKLNELQKRKTEVVEKLAVIAAQIAQERESTGKLIAQGQDVDPSSLSALIAEQMTLESALQQIEAEIPAAEVQLKLTRIDEAEARAVARMEKELPALVKGIRSHCEALATLATEARALYDGLGITADPAIYRMLLDWTGKTAAEAAAYAPQDRDIAVMIQSVKTIAKIARTRLRPAVSQESPTQTPTPSESFQKLTKTAAEFNYGGAPR